MKTLLERSAALALVALGAVACSSSSNLNPIVDSGTGTDVATAIDNGNSSTDTGNGDSGNSTDTGSAIDAGPSTSVTMAQLANTGATGHPASGTVVSISDTNLVALSPRFVSGPSAAGNCSISAWVGTSTGGNYSAVEVFESIHAPAPADGGEADCFATTVVGSIPLNLETGDQISGLRGTADLYCASGSACPAYASLELEVSASHGGAMTDTGPGGTVPSPATVMISDVTGMGATAGGMDQGLQNTLVTISGTVLTVVPAEASHNVMMVAASTTAGAPAMPVQVAYYDGVTCQRDILGAAAPGYMVGTVTGLLEFDFGQWVIQPRSKADLPSVVCPTDGGTSTDATSTDATATGSDVPSTGG